MNGQEALKKDLLNLDPKNFYLKHIVKSKNWYFSDYLRIPPDELVDRMDFFKEIVSSRFNINFHNLQIVGSAKTGFSLSPSKLFRPFHDEIEGQPSSDIDIAIISDKLFLQYWNNLRFIKKIRYSLTYKKLTDSIFNGYINDKELIKFKELKEKWENTTREINLLLQDELGFVHPVTYRLYRSWDDLEEYQLIGISKARHSLEEKEDV